MTRPPTGGPSGTARDPPAWLATATLPPLVIPAATKLHRVHQVVHDPIFFGPAINPTTGMRGPPTYRFDSASGTFGVFYCAAEMEGAFVETVMRNPQTRLHELGTESDGNWAFEKAEPFVLQLRQLILDLFDERPEPFCRFQIMQFHENLPESLGTIEMQAARHASKE